MERYNDILYYKLPYLNIFTDVAPDIMHDMLEGVIRYYIHNVLISVGYIYLDFN